MPSVAAMPYDASFAAVMAASLLIGSCFKSLANYLAALQSEVHV